MKRVITVLLIVAAIGAGAGAYYIRRGGPGVQVNTAAITRGDITDSVGATGTLQAVTTVQVGSQVSGNIEWLGADFNSIVHKGQQIARLDPSLFQTQVEAARANLARAKADVARDRVDVEAAQTKFTRAQELAARKLLPSSHLDSAKTALDAAMAQYQSAQAAVVQNVTTYGTVSDVPNPELKLKPGMTANVKIEIARRSDVLRIPNAALRFRPSADVFAALNQQVPPEAQSAGGRGRSVPSSGQNPPVPGSGAPQQTPPGGAAPPGTATAPGQSSSGAAPPIQYRGGEPRNRGADAGEGANGEEGGTGREHAGGRGFDPARMMERFRGMSPDDQKQFIARMKSRGMDVSAFEKQMKPAPSLSAALKPKYGAPQSAQTIDALFAPLPNVESRGRAWLFMDRQLKPVNLRLGISDGTNTELLSTELQPNMEVVTGVTGLGTTRTVPGAGGTGNPLLPGGRSPGGFGGGGGRGR